MPCSGGRAFLQRAPSITAERLRHALVVIERNGRLTFSPPTSGCPARMATVSSATCDVSRGPLRDVPAVAVTACVGSQDRSLALQAGLDRHIGKPIEPEQLVRVVTESAHARP